MEQTSPPEGHIHLLCPYCFNQFDVSGPGMYTNAMAAVECPSCTARFYFMPVVFSDITPERLANSVSAFLSAQVHNGGQEATIRPIGEIISEQQKRKEKGGENESGN